jgi:ribosome biogenesis GTPase / thiamine phosphate phosphatase
MADNTGRVIQSTGKWYKVYLGGKTIECRIPGKFRLDKREVTNPIAVGDFVSVRIEDDQKGTITEIRDRNNYIPRQATHGRRGEQILVSNIDRAWAIQSITQPKLNLGFVDRFLVTCEAYEVPAGVVINKMDLANEKSARIADEVTEIYESAGYPVSRTSVYDEKSLHQFADILKNQTSVFIGPSGAGKSSLLNAIDPQLNLKVGEISSYSKKGKHTTTFAKLVPLKGGGYIVDTPGIREFGVVNIEKSELSLYFPEMLEPRQRCKFYNCTHFHEPDCGVITAYQEGNIHPERYNSYLNILESLER